MEAIFTRAKTEKNAQSRENVAENGVGGQKGDNTGGRERFTGIRVVAVEYTSEGTAPRDRVGLRYSGRSLLQAMR